jgi:hypothetical protein
MIVMGASRHMEMRRHGPTDQAPRGHRSRDVKSEKTLIATTLLAVLLSQALVNPAPRAWESTPTLRPLTEAEAWDYTVAGSDAIGIGRIRDVQVVSAEPPATAGIGQIYRGAYELSFLPSHWLKGTLPRTSQILLCSRDRLHTRNYDVPLEETIDEPVLVFLRESEGRLYLFESRAGYQGGVFRIDPDEIEDLKEMVDGAVKRSSLDSLVGAADLVVIGTPIVGETRPCRAEGRNANCSLLEIEETLAGTSLESRIVAHGMHGALPMERSIFFLKLTGEGVHGTVPFYGGILPIRGDRVPDLNMGVSEAGFEIRRIARLLATPEPIPPFTPTRVGDEIYPGR